MDSPARRFAHVEELFEHLACFIDDHTVLWALCLTSHACYRIFRKHLWANIVWDHRSDGFFQSNDRLEDFLNTHAIGLARTRSLRGIKRVNAGIDAGEDDSSYLAGMEKLQQHMPKLKSYEWTGSWSRDAILTLARNCPSLEALRIGVDCNEVPYEFKQRGSWDTSQRALASLKSVSIYPSSSTCETVEGRATVSGYISRLILRQAPVLESLEFDWPKIKCLDEEILAVEDFLFYFIGFLALEEVSLDRGLLSQAESASSWPPMLRKVDVCVCPCDPQGRRSCPRCTGQQWKETASRLDDNDERLLSLSKRVGDAFEWACQECLDQVSCEVWSDEDSFWHVSVITTARP